MLPTILRTLFVLSTLILASNAFCIPYNNGKLTVVDHGRSTLQMIPDSTSFLTAVEVFDGSSIVDPVVVSNVFWTSLKGKILAVIVGQVLATVVFSILASFAASQISQMGNFVSKFISSPISNNVDSGKTFIKATDITKSNQATATPDFSKLLVCLAIDVVGSSSEVIPILGELTDVIYAPIAATLLRSLYGGSNVIFALEFAEEILPFTDILPLATLW